MSPVAAHAALAAASLLLWGLIGGAGLSGLGLVLLLGAACLRGLRAVAPDEETALLGALGVVCHPALASGLAEGPLGRLGLATGLAGVMALALQPQRRSRLLAWLLGLGGGALIFALQPPLSLLPFPLARIGRALTELAAPMGLAPSRPAPAHSAEALTLGLVGAAALALALRGRRDLAGGLLLVLLLAISVAVGDPSAAWTPSLLLVPALGLGLLAVRARADFGPALWLFPATMMTFSALQAPAYRSPVAQTVAIAAASPASPGARAAAARALIDAGRLEEAEAAIAALEADLGRSPDLFAVQGHLLHVGGKDGAAIPLLESALGGDPNQIEAAIELVGILRARGDLEGARFHAGRLAELHPDRPEGAALLAELGGP